MRKYGLIVFITFALMLVLLEFGLRLAERPINSGAMARKCYSTPANCYVPDSVHMLRLNDGSYVVTLNGLKFSANHINGTRMTTGAVKGIAGKIPKIYVFGCSFTYGIGVNDSDTYCSFLQADFNQTVIKNFGIPGGSNLHSLLQLNECLAHCDTPDIAILSCSELHYERNAFSPRHRYVLNKGAQVWFARMLKENEAGKRGPVFDSITKTARYSYGDLVDDRLTIKNEPVVLCYKPFPLRDKLELCNELDFLINYKLAKSYPENERAITAKIVESFIGLCKKAGVKLIIHDFNYTESSKFVADICTREEITFVPGNIAWSKELTNYPYDGHPNRKGQYEIYKMLAQPVKSELTEQYQVVN